MGVTRWGRARVEVFALREEISAGLRELRPISEIYGQLKKAGKVSVSERSFYRWAEPLVIEAAHRTRKAMHAQSGPAPASAGALAPSGRPVPAPTPITGRARAGAASEPVGVPSKVISPETKRLTTAATPTAELWGDEPTFTEGMKDGND